MFSVYLYFAVFPLIRQSWHWCCLAEEQPGPESRDTFHSETLKDSGREDTQGLRERAEKN